MYRIVEKRISRLLHGAPKGLLKDTLIGLEKESLRVSANGGIAQTPHPERIGAALAHPYITTDYSEALLEFITPAYNSMREVLQFLCNAQTFVYQNLEDEFIWGTSMPCVVAGESGIPIAQYGRSNLGKMKTIYRRGLGYRYGRVMQVIAGVHFNFSLPDAFWSAYQSLEGAAGTLREFKDEHYFGMIRNLQRLGWIIPYLFGASPAVCKSFLCGKPTPMPEFDAKTYYEPYGTSLRMGDIGYQNKKEHECGIRVYYDDLDTYVDCLNHAITTPCPDWEKIGVIVDGEYRQLNTHLLQIENEYYSTIRPKQIAQHNERPSLALKQRGVRYVELRSVDVNAYDPLGINLEQMHFLEAFLVFCLLHESPLITQPEATEINFNQSIAAHRGREPGLQLQRLGKKQSLAAWASEICAAMRGICELLDMEKYGGPGLYAESLARQRDVARDPDRTPSARMLREMRANRETFYEFALRMSQQHRQYFASRQLSADRLDFFRNEATNSLRKQRELEESDNQTFEEFLRGYFA